ncbi:MAG: lipid A deacylase LpxR family protein [Planctomycetota bacterium]
MPRPVRSTPRSLPVTLLLTTALIFLGGCRAAELRVVEDNDFFLRGRSTDRYYTQGTRVDVAGPTDQFEESKLSSFLRWLRIFPDHTDPREIQQFGSFGVSQLFFTPSDISLDPRVPADEAVLAKDRPYAGWLFGAFGLHQREFDPLPQRQDRLDTVELQVGMIGPHSYGEDIQRWWHQVIGSPDPKGWDQQIGDELGVNLIWLRHFRTYFNELAFGEFDTLQSFGGALGTVDTYGQIGAILRYGWNLPRDFGYGTISAIDPVSKDFSLYFSVGTQGRYVARNATLDGRLFAGDIRTATREPFVAELRSSVTVRWYGLALSYAVASRTPEFTRGSDPQRYGTIDFRWAMEF